MTKENSLSFLYHLPIEKYYPETGIHRYALENGTCLTGISADTWSEYCSLLIKTTGNDTIIASPELITYQDDNFENIVSYRQIIEERLLWMLDFSVSRRESLFIVGTPLFGKGSKPRNSAVLIKNGSIVGVTNKRTGATDDERKHFELMAEEPPLLIPGTETSLLICADLPTAGIYSHPVDEHTDRILELANRSNLIGKKVECIHPAAKSLLVISCWGVGGTYVKKGKADEYYRLQLRNITWRLMRESAINEVVMVDRVPCDTAESEKGMTPGYPYNGILKKGW